MSAIPLQTLEQMVHRMNTTHTLIHAEYPAGGASAQVVLLHVQHGDTGITQKYMLRIHSEINRWRNPAIAGHEYHVLKALHESGLPVAQPQLLDESGEIYPVPYVILDYIEGAPVFAPPDLADFIRQSAELLAKIHQVKKPLATLDFLSKRPGHVLWWIQYQPEQLDDTINEGWLRDTLRTLFPLQQVNTNVLLHGDFWSGNLIWRDGSLVGVIDLEDTELGDPLSDLSIARLDILWSHGQDAMHDFTRIYQAHMPHLDYGQLPQWDLFSALRQANQLTGSARLWAESGRPDVTFATMQQAHHWFAGQAIAKLK